MARTDGEYADRYAFYMAYKQTCGYCGLPLKFKDFEIDHIIPVSVASDPQKWAVVLRDYALPEGFGVENDGNRIAVCRPCNRDKHDALLNPKRIAIYHHDAEQKALQIRKFREERLSDLTIQRALAKVTKARSDAKLGQQDLLDLLGPNPDDLVRSVVTAWPSDEAQTQFRDLLGTASVTLLDWPQEIEGHWLVRPEFDEIRTALACDETRLIVLLGPPGCGKSALLARLGTELRAAGRAILALKADTLPSQVGSLSAIDEWLCVPESLPILLDRIAAAAPVTLLIDQLDALSDVMDLHSERLAALLVLINRVLATPGIHVIVSCREFDAEYDLRLNSLINKAGQCVTIRLADLPWDLVDDFLHSKGYECGSWPDPVKKVLCRPHRLKLFVRHFSPRLAQPSFTSYQAMLEQILQEAVVRPFGQLAASALETLAELVADSEELWVPRLRLDSAFQEQLPKLQASGIVMISPDNLRIGFEHQTVFEFIRARSFVSGNRTLQEEALLRQDGLAVRPVLWGAVNYLRNADWSRYCIEVGALLQHSAVRLHVKVLIIEFLGTVPQPALQESGWIKQLLPSDKLRRHLMRAIEKKPAWWALMKNWLLECCEFGPFAAYHASWVIGPALAYDKAFILSSIEAQWLCRADLDFATFNLFRDFDEWDKAACGIVETILSRTTFAEVWVCKIAQSISKLYPDAAVRVLRRKLDADLERARSECFPPPEALPADAGVDEQIAHLLSDRSLRPIENLVRAHGDWYGVDIIAKASPRHFIEGLWTWVEAVCLDLTARNELRPNGYRDDHKWNFGENFTSYISQALWTAVSQFAANEPDRFVEWAKQSSRSEAMPVHRLIIKGFEAIVHRRPEAVLEYCLGDQRRFAIADSTTGENGTDLIEALGSVLKPPDTAALVAAIESWEPVAYGDADDESAQIIRSNHRARLRILARLPHSHLRKEIQDELASRSERESAMPAISPVRDGFIKSPVMMKEMENMDDSDLLAILEEYPDSRGMSFADHAGGAGHVATQFEEFAKKHPDRVFRIAPQLKPGRQELAAAAGIAGVCEIKSVPEARILDLIHELTAHGFDSVNFKQRLCWAMVKLAQRTTGLPDRSIDLLVEIARTCAVDRSDEPIKEEPAKTQRPLFAAIDTEADRPGRKPSKSILWAHLGGSLPHGSFPALTAVMLGLLRREPPDYPRWILVMEEHLGLPNDPKIWQALLSHLRFLGSGDLRSANDFIRRLFEKYPTILPTIDGARFVASSHLWLDQPLLDDLLACIERSEWEHAGRATGEIFLLRAALVPDDENAQRRVESAINNLGSATGAFECGVVCSASNTWVNPRFRPTSHRVLMAAMSSPDTDVIDSVMDAFSSSEGIRIPADSRTSEVLRAIAQVPTRFVSPSMARPFIERLKELLQDSFSPREVAMAARSVIEVAGDRISDIGSAFYTSSDDLMNIAITLQRFGETRADGTWIFEQLIAANAYKIDEAVQILDRRL